MEKWCWVIGLFGGQYTAETANSKLGVASFMVEDCKKSVGSLGTRKWDMEVRTSMAAPPWDLLSGWSVLYVV